MTTAPADPTLLALDRLPADPADVVYLTKYVGKLDSGIAFTDHFYLDALARSPLSTQVIANRVPAEVPRRLLSYSSWPLDHRRQRPLLQISNGLGSFQHHTRGAVAPEHADALSVAVIHDEPSAYDLYGTAVWNRQHVVDTLMAAQDAYIFVSSTCQAAWSAYPGIAAKPQFHLPNTCAEEEHIAAHVTSRPRAAVRSLRGYDDAVVHLAVVATVQPRKAQLTAIEALARLRESDPARRYRLRIIGRVTQPAYQRECVRRAAELGVTADIEFLGELPKPDVLDHLYASDVLLSPSQSEAMPLVLLEAMQLRTPIVATPVGGVREMLDDDSALFFAPGDADELAGRIRDLLSAPAATSQRRERAAARYAAEFSNARFRERFAAVLRELVRLAPTRDTAPTPDGSAARAERVRLTLHPDAVPAAAVVRGTGLADALTSAAPLVRAGLALTGIGADRRSVELTRSAEPLLRENEIAVLLNTDAHVRAHSGDAARISAAERERARRRVEEQRARVHRRDRHWIGGRLRHLLRRVPGLRHLADRRRAARRRPQPPPVPAAVFVFNSPTQLVTALALWDHLHEDRVSGASGGAATPLVTPLVAAVYSTGGAADFSSRLATLAERTGRFAHVVDITPIYRRVYAPAVTTRDLHRLRHEFRRSFAPYTATTALMAAFMSARAQKLLYETFAGARIRLFEDGLGSYVPKPIKMADDGMLDRVTSGDCAEAHHIRRIASVDLLLHGVAVPPQYAGTVPGLRYPELHVGRFRPDFAATARLFGATPRAFAADEVLVATQNFADHLHHRGLTIEREREINDAVIAALVAEGRRVVVRPHPRASADVWSARWDAHPAVTVWREDAGLPVEALVTADAPPSMLVGISSSCLFTLGAGEAPLVVRRYPDSAFDMLGAHVTAEYELMLGIARSALPPLSAGAEAPPPAGHRDVDDVTSSSATIARPSPRTKQDR